MASFSSPIETTDFCISDEFGECDPYTFNANPDDPSTWVCIDSSENLSAGYFIDQFVGHLSYGSGLFSPENLTHESLVSPFLENFDLVASTRVEFNEATLPFEGAPDLNFSDAAQIYASVHVSDGSVTLSQPPLLQGVSTLFGVVDIGGLKLSPKGRVLADFEDLPGSKDIHDEVMESFLGPLFPGKKVRPVPVADLIHFDLPPKIEKILRKAVSDVVVKFRVLPPDYFKSHPRLKKETPVLAQGEVFVDVSEFQKTLLKGSFASFDFSGIGEGSHMEWPRLPLNILPWPEGIEVADGTVDLSWEYEPVNREMLIGLRNLDAQILMPEIFGEKPLVLKGHLYLTLHAGGEVEIQFDDFSFDLPAFPSITEPRLAIKATMTGNAELDISPSDGEMPVENVHLMLHDIDLATQDTEGIHWGPLTQLAAALQGEVTFDYEKADVALPLHASWDLQGTLYGALDDRIVEVRNLDFHGDGGWHVIGGDYFPNLQTFEAMAVADVAYAGQMAGEGVLADRVWVTLQGQGGGVVEGIQQKYAQVQMGADNVHVGVLSFRPVVDLHLASFQTDENYRVEGDGHWLVQSLSPVLELGSEIHFSMDPETFEWSAEFTQNQILGAVEASGGLIIEGHGERDPGSSVSSPFFVRTIKPYDLSVRGEKRVRGLNISGGGNSVAYRVSLASDSLWDHFRARVDLQGNGRNDRLRGNYHLEARPLQSEELVLSDFVAEGKLSTRILSEPRIAVRGISRGKFQGEINGPFESGYEGLLYFVPREVDGRGSVYFTFDPENPSTVTFGPMSLADDPLSLSGQANLVGSLAVVGGPEALEIHGSRAGIRGGKIYVYRGYAPKTLFADNLAIVADEITGVRDGIVYAGGDGIRTEAWVFPGGSRHHVVSVVDRLPFLKSGYWNDFRKFVEAP